MFSQLTFPLQKLFLLNSAYLGTLAGLHSACYLVPTVTDEKCAYVSQSCLKMLHRFHLCIPASSIYLCLYSCISKLEAAVLG